MIKYHNGDVFDYISDQIKNKQDYIVFPHVVNVCNAFGSGLAAAFVNKYPSVKDSYHIYCKFAKSQKELFGEVDYVHLDNFTVANMFAQTLGGKRPLYYNHLAKAMKDVADYIVEARNNECPCQIVTVKFGSGLARGNWNFIEELIHDIWIRDLKINVTVCIPQ